MSVIFQNGFSVIIREGKVIINGEEISTPRDMKFNSQSIIDGKVFIDGYEYFPKLKQFKRTLRALWEHLFS